MSSNEGDARDFQNGGPAWGSQEVRLVPWTSAEEVDPASLNITADECVLDRHGVCIRDHRHHGDADSGGQA